MIRGLEYVPYKELGLFNLEKTEKDRISAESGYLKGEFWDDGAGPFLVLPSDRMKSSGHKLRHKKLYLSMRKKLFMLKVTEHGNKLSRKDVESLSLETFKTHLTSALPKRRQVLWNKLLMIINLSLGIWAVKSSDCIDCVLE